jgi:hypothetical protein
MPSLSGDEWLNSPPLTTAAVRGHVVPIDPALGGSRD